MNVGQKGLEEGEVEDQGGRVGRRLKKILFMSADAVALQR